MKNSLAGLMLVALSLVACKLGGSEPAANCNASQVPENEFCFEYPKQDFSSIKPLCDKWGGTWSNGACDRTNALGACRLSNGNTKVFYAGTQFKSAEDAKLKCFDKWLGPNEK